MSEIGRTSIQVDEKTRDRLRGFGKKGESYAEIINKLIDIVERKTKA